MSQYKVELISIDRKVEIKNLCFSTYVEANSSDDSIEKAKAIHKREHPEINLADNWWWNSFETAEQHHLQKE